MTIAFISIAALLGIGFLWEAWARSRDAKIWTHPGKLVDVGGHQLHVRAQGEGDVVVVFEADEGCWSTHWGRLPQDLSSVTASVAYDRGGLGWSEPGPPPRDAETLARELHQLLARLAPGQPAILVGHGTGAHILRAYAHRYPFETVGLVLVDPFHDGIGDRLRREQIPPATASPFLISLTSFLGTFGILRLMQSKLSGNAALNLPGRQRATLDALELNPRVRRGATEELVAETQTLEYLRRIQESNEFPMRILTSTKTLSPDMVPADFPLDTYNRIWTEQSEAFLDLSSQAKRVLVEGSGHQLQLERPEVVMQAILDVLDEVNAQRSQPEGEAEAAHLS